MKLQKECQEKDRKIDILTRSANKSYALTQKHGILKTELNRLKKKHRTCSEIDSIFKPDQREALLLKRKSTRGLKWNSETIQEGLIYKMKCGTQAYSDLVKQYPLFPSVRCLQKYVQFIVFDSGILNQIFDLLEIMVKTLHDNEKDCCLAMDEMAIKEDE